MGIRVKKILGWAMRIEEDDPRVNFDVLGEELYDLDVDAYQRFIEELYEEDAAKDVRDKDLDLMSETEFLRHPKAQMELNQEYTLIYPRDFAYVFHTVGPYYPATLCVTPMHYANSWVRYGDTIDHVEAEIQETKTMNMDPEIHWLDDNPFPYNGMYWDIRDFHMLTRQEVMTTKIDDVCENMAPMVPSSVLRAAEWTGILAEEHARQLRPVYIKYWT